MAKLKVKQLDVSAAIEHATDSNIKIRLDDLDVEYTALVTEVTKNGVVEGVLLYVPGMNYRLLRKVSK